jgi:hypothetical protein
MMSRHRCRRPMIVRPPPLQMCLVARRTDASLTREDATTFFLLGYHRIGAAMPSGRGLYSATIRMRARLTLIAAAQTHCTDPLRLMTVVSAVMLLLAASTLRTTIAQSKSRIPTIRPLKAANKYRSSANAAPICIHPKVAYQ